MLPEDKIKLKVWKHEQKFPVRKPLTPEEKKQRHLEILQYRRHAMTPVQHIEFCKTCKRNEWGTTVKDKFGCFECLKCGTCNSLFHPCHCRVGLDKENNCINCGASHYHLVGLFDD